MCGIDAATTGSGEVNAGVQADRSINGLDAVSVGAGNKTTTWPRPVLVGNETGVNHASNGSQLPRDQALLVVGFLEDKLKAGQVKCSKVFVSGDVVHCVSFRLGVAVTTTVRQFTHRVNYLAKLFYPHLHPYLLLYTQTPALVDSVKILDSPRVQITAP